MSEFPQATADRVHNLLREVDNMHALASKIEDAARFGKPPSHDDAISLQLCLSAQIKELSYFQEAILRLLKETD